MNKTEHKTLGAGIRSLSSLNPYRDRDGCLEGTCFRRGYAKGRAEGEKELALMRAELARYRNRELANVFLEVK